MGTFSTIAELRSWLELAPAGTTVPAAALLELLAVPTVPASEPAAPRQTEGWRVTFWSCPAETRIGVAELLEALGKPRSWLYRHTSEKSGLPRIPHRKLDGGLLFVVGEVRAWLREHEEVVEAGPMETTRTERRLWAS
jgi:predicted DNA-binding transcriptional regulator AlpA